MRKIAIVIVSDRCTSGEEVDKTGPALRQFFEAHPRIVKSSDNTPTSLSPNISLRIVPDEIHDIQAAVTKYCDEQQVNLLVTSGGTGFSKRDVTPEAVTPMLHKQAPGIVHAMTAYGLQQTKFAWLSRPVAGVRGSSIVICVPGSPKAAIECLTPLMENGLEHAMELAAGNQRDPHPTTGSVSSDTTSDARPSSGDRTIGRPPPSPSSARRLQKDLVASAMQNRPKVNVANRARESPYEMVPMEHALRMILEQTPKPIPIRRSITGGSTVRNILGCVLAEDVVANFPHPPFRASVKDGYAVNSRDGPGVYPVQGALLAGSSDDAPLRPGHIMRVNTGGPVPEGADAVLQVEDTILESSDNGQETQVKILKSVPPGNDIRPVGCDLAANQIAIPKGAVVKSAEIGLALAVGFFAISVYRRPIVAVLSTGDELADLSTCVNGELPKGKIFDSNRGMLIAALEEAGYETVDLGIAKDEYEDTAAKVASGLAKADVIITSGGVSMGEVDFVKDVLLSLRATIHFGRVNMKPGKPMTFATKGNHMFFGLPGNPVSAMVCFHLFVMPALLGFEGKPTKPRTVRAVLDADVRLDKQRPEYHRCFLRFDHVKGYFIASSTGIQASHRLQSMAGANGLMVLPTGSDAQPNIPAGNAIEVIVIGPIEN